MVFAGRSGLCVVLAGLIAVAPVASQTEGGGGAMLSARGSVKVNGSEVPGSKAIANGDKVQTGSRSAANLTSKGSTALLGASSSVAWQGDYLGLDNGTVVVSSDNGLAVQAGNLRVTPALPGTAKYEVARGSCQTTVAAQAGDLTLSDGSNVKQGQSVTRDTPCVAGAAPGQGAPPAAAASGGGLSTGALAAIGLGAAGTAAAIAILTTGNKKPVSPAAP